MPRGEGSWLGANGDSYEIYDDFEFIRERPEIRYRVRRAKALIFSG